MDEYVQLKCKSCGATLEPGDSNSDTLVCPSCGSIQQRIDSKKYLDQVKNEMMAWLNKAMPTGINVSAENMDPVARHSIFVNSIRPNLDSEYRDYRFGFMQILANPMMYMPHTCTNLNVRHDPKRVFEFNAKVKSVSQLAVDDDAKKLMKESSGISMAYASIMNNASLFTNDSGDRYTFVNNNFKQSAEALKDVEGFEIIQKRFDALQDLSEGITMLSNGRSQSAIVRINSAKGKLESVLKEISTDIDFSIMSKAVKQEISVCDSMASIADAMNECPNLDPASVLTLSSSMIAEMERERKSASGVWDVQMKRPNRSSDVFNMLRDTLRAKSGERTFRVVRGDGNLYLPMWAVEFKYSFVTGVLFKKKAVEVSELLFVAATFLTSGDCISNPALAVTDIFRGVPDSSLGERLKGLETSLSSGCGVKEAMAASSVSSLPDNIKCAVPMCTATEAELLCNSYIDKCRSEHSKLSMGNAHATELIFVPCTMNGDSITINLKLSDASPRKVGNAETINRLTI